MSPLAIAAVLLVSAMSTDGTARAAQRGDFGFRFEIGSCRPERFDTFTGVFARAMEDGQTGTANLTLSDAQMTEIYETIWQIRFFDFRSNFSGAPPGLGLWVASQPNITYRLEVRSSGKVHTVTWNNGIAALTAEAERLRDLFLKITRIIHDHLSVKQLPFE